MFRCKSTLAILSAATALTIGSTTFADDVQTHQGDQLPTPHGMQTLKEASNNTKDLADRHMGMMGNETDALVLKQLNAWKSTPDKAPDAMFTLEAACGNMWEVEVSKLVAEKSQDQQVKDTANMISTDHQMAEQKLEPIAQKLGVMLPTKLSAEKQAKLAILRELPADKLEQHYLSAMRADHLKDVNMFADEAKSATDPDLKAYATDTLPHLKEHTAMLIKVADTRGITTETNFQKPAMAQ